jgi:3D (Asp-Asp-Asp) domain-containing protein
VFQKLIITTMLAGLLCVSYVDILCAPMVESTKVKETNLVEKTPEQPEVVEVFEFIATAYWLGDGNGDIYTASMTIPRVDRTVAVDPRVIPYGTKLIINGVGGYVAEDTGGAIKGNRIDIYMGDDIDAYYKAIEHGVRTVRVEIEKEV